MKERVMFHKVVSRVRICDYPKTTKVVIEIYVNDSGETAHFDDAVILFVRDVDSDQTSVSCYTSSAAFNRSYLHFGCFESESEGKLIRKVVEAYHYFLGC